MMSQLSDRSHVTWSHTSTGPKMRFLDEDKVLGPGNGEKWDEDDDNHQPDEDSDTLYATDKDNEETMDGEYSFSNL
jgi:hypothetical protein